MSSIPPDIYERVHELSLAITNASEAGDEARHDSLCQTLRVYFEEQTADGCSHPLLTEAVADYTDEPAEAARLYELALTQAQALAGEQTHMKMISLAARLIELGRREQAEAYLCDGRAEAVRLSDTFWIKDADRLLQQLAP